MNTSDRDIPLTGLKGSSLLGFMSALGTLNTLQAIPEATDCKMKWVMEGSSFIPVLRLPGALDREALVEKLEAALKSLADHPAFTFADDLKISGKAFRLMADAQVKEYLSNNQFGAGMAAAFGCDVIVNDDGGIQDTAFRTMSGAGHQHFVLFMNELCKNTNATHLQEALFGPWRYRDPSPVMRWDDEDDRRYALRWDEPSKDPVRTVRGANRLAIASLPLFPVVPTSSSAVATTSFKGGKSNNTFITWPIWSCWLTADILRSVLSLKELQKDQPSISEMSGRGITAIFRSQRITLGKYRNFTPARSM